MKSREFNVVIERDEEALLVASVASLPGCHTQGSSLDELMDRVREAISLSLEVEGESFGELEIVGVLSSVIPSAARNLAGSS